MVPMNPEGGARTAPLAPRLQGDDHFPPEILPLSDLTSPVNGILWEMSELITQVRIAVGSSKLVEGLIT